MKPTAPTPCCAVLATILATASGIPPAMAETTETFGVTTSLRVVGAAIDGERISELSGLAWDEDEQRLYAISDRGVLFRFKVTLGNHGELDVEPIAANRLAPPAGALGVDAEGLAVDGSRDGLKGNSSLLVSTEGPPRVIRYTPSGQPLETLPLAGGLGDPARYDKANAMLEAVTIHPAHGLLAAAEAPLAGAPDDQHQIFSNGRAWTFSHYPANDSRLKGMDVMKDGHLLVLERAERGKGKARSMLIALREVDIGRCEIGQPCPVRDLAVLDRPDETDNFEGLTYLGNGRVMIVSDDRGKSGRGTTFTVLQPRTPGQ